MKKTILLMTCLALIAGLMCTSCTWMQPPVPEHTARLVEVVNLVEAHPQPKDDWEAATVGMNIFIGGQARTGADSARLQLLGGTVRIWSDSIFTVSANRAGPDEVVTDIFLEQGRIWAHLNPDQPHHFTVETNSVVTAVRDTHFSVMAAPDQNTLVSVAQGQVLLSSEGDSLTLAAGQQHVSQPGEPLGPPQPMSDLDGRSGPWRGSCEIIALLPTITPSPTLTPDPTPTPVPTGTATPTLVPTATQEPTPTPSPTFTPTPSPTPVPMRRIPEDVYLISGRHNPNAGGRQRGVRGIGADPNRAPGGNGRRSDGEAGSLGGPRQRFLPGYGMDRSGWT